MCGPQLVLLGQHGVGEPLVLGEVEVEPEPVVLRGELHGDVQEALQHGLVMRGHLIIQIVIGILENVKPKFILISSTSLPGHSISSPSGSCLPL